MSAENAYRDSLALSSDQLRSIQLGKLNTMLMQVCERPYFSGHLAGSLIPLKSLEDLASLPLMTKDALLGDTRCSPGRVFDLPRCQYTRLHQTSGTRGFPMAVLDTPDDWAWWLRCWDFVLDAANVTDQDVALMAFSFGPFIGFWTAHDALVRRRATVVPGGGMSSENRLQMINDYECTVMCCTPTYALHLSEVAKKLGIDLTRNTVSRIIVAGEPGGSIASIRHTIEHAWGAKVIDHTGASEVGAWGFGSDDGRGIHVIETEFIAECLVFDDDSPGGRTVDDGEPAELVLTSLGRLGGPVLRYRTGDIVRGYRNHDQPCKFLWLDGGVLGRSDDMIVIRGVNVFPSSIEAIIREVESTAEFRIIVTRKNHMDQLAIEVEAEQSSADRLAGLLRDRLAMRIDVQALPSESLPKFEAKAKRLIDRR
ncbi:phenylacetate--CoA ligase family protein [Rubripirellula reticaptiva]|uniref:Phenylacetate-coenzyme A ligase n=1 Tax=Rubripirellula reticaptiva TaxID=2528013 RepID=A0A5C6FBX1_9BACT|nr:phenylacetate--CoA ligase family protein [Rubripirellula reticaptiva]TWU58077.1 Phenylacetate-coenzyme A ligase [Rubripirellula reticaptiva]